MKLRCKLTLSSDFLPRLTLLSRTKHHIRYMNWKYLCFVSLSQTNKRRKGGGMAVRQTRFFIPFSWLRELMHVLLSVWFQHE